MGKNKYVVDHHEIIEVMFEIKYNREYDFNKHGDSDKWNGVCDEFDNDLEGDYDLSSIKTELEDDSESLLNQALFKILTDDNKKSLKEKDAKRELEKNIR